MLLLLLAVVHISSGIVQVFRVFRVGFGRDWGEVGEVRVLLEEGGDGHWRVPEVGRGESGWVEGAVEEVGGGLRGGVAVGTRRRRGFPYCEGICL